MEFLIAVRRFSADFSAILSIETNFCSFKVYMSEKVFNIMEFMDNLDDVQEVHTNGDFPEDFEVKG